MSSKPVLGYWDIRGFGAPIRLLLNYTETDFEDKLYVTGPAPDFNKDCWFSVKETLGIPFPNLPYYLDGEFKVSQMNAIMRYIARKNDLLATELDAQVRQDVLESENTDMRNNYAATCYSPDFEKKRDPYVEQMKKVKLPRISKFLGDKPWFTGEKLNMVDFMLYESLDHNRILEPTILDEFQNLQDFMKRFEALPQIAKYMASDKYQKGPINNRMAKWGN